MNSLKTLVVSSRKRPSQQRSTRLVEAILEAAVRVLMQEGARRFTAARVAEAAGVSVGSLYQYFPNKEAILFQLQVNEWARTHALLESILGDTSRAPLDRLRATVAAFFRTEYDEASFRMALDDAAPLYRDSPEAQRHAESAMRMALTFMEKALPDVQASQRAFAADVLMTVMSTVGESASTRAQSSAEMDSWASEIGDMLCAYVDHIGGCQPSSPGITSSRISGATLKP